MAKLAVITGGSRGLGRSGALALAKNGVDIILTYLSNRDAAQDVVGQIRSLGQRASCLQLDVRDLATYPDFIKKLEAVLLDEFSAPQFDYLLNNAGTGLSKPFIETTVEEFDDLYNLHLKAPYFLTQALLPLVKNGGHIVNVSSGLTRFSIPGASAYAAMKGGVEVLTRYLAKELGSRGIFVNTLAPGAIATDFNGGAVRDNQDIHNYLASMTAKGRVGEAEDIGSAISLLLSDKSFWITGQRIEASGGMFL